MFHSSLRACYALLLACMPILASHSALANGTHSNLKIEVVNDMDLNSREGVLKLRLRDGHNLVLGPDQLRIEHEKLFHLFMFDKGLKNFAHLHPVPNEAEPGTWTVPYKVANPGTYKFWGDVTTKAGQKLTGFVETLILGDGDESVPATGLPEKLQGEDKETVLTLNRPDGGFVAGRDLMVTFTLWRTTSDEQTNIVEYLGAPAHFAVFTVDGTQMIHAHPMEMGGEYMLHGLNFPRAGDYRVWVQFIDRKNPNLPLEDEVHTVLLNIKVN